MAMNRFPKCLGETDIKISGLEIWIHGNQMTPSLMLDVTKVENMVSAMRHLCGWGEGAPCCIFSACNKVWNDSV